MSKLKKISVTLLAAVGFALATLTPSYAQQGPFTPGVSYSANQFLGPYFEMPQVTAGTGLFVKWTSGNIFIAGKKVAVAGNLASNALAVTASQASCQSPAFTGCNFIYANSSGTVAATTTIATATAASNSILALCTTSGSAVLVCTYPYEDTTFSAVMYPVTAASLTNPMTTNGDLITGGASGAPTRLVAGTSTQILQGGSSPAFSSTPTVDTSVTIGKVGTATGALLLKGTTSGTVTINGNDTSTYNFNLPSGAGSSGQPLLSGGGGAGAMTFGTLGVGAGGTGATSFTSNNLVLGGATLGQANGLSSDGTSVLKLGVASASTGGVQFANTTSGTVTLQAPATGALGSSVLTLPANTGVTTSLAAVYSCGATSGSVACGNTPSTGLLAHVLTGVATLSANTAVISGLVPAFTSTSSYSCVGNDSTTRANPVQIVQTSASSFIITNTTGATDVIQYVCVGF